MTATRVSWGSRMRAKIGLATVQDGDNELTDGFLKLLAQDRVDYTIAMRRLAGFSTAPNAGNARPL